MTRKECLEQAMGCVLRDRQKQYGEPEDCFETIAMMWSAYLGKIIQGWDVAAMMALLKVARIKANPAHADNWCDLAGYAACGAECRQKFEAEMKKTVEDAFETFPHLKPETESGCFQNGNDHSPEASAEPEFKPGDTVQARLGDGVWRDAVVSGKEITCGKLYYTVKVADFNGYYSLQADDVRPAPKAEGCDEPEFKRGDKVQAFNGEEWVDCRYIRWKEPEGRHVVQYKGCMCAIDPENLRPVSRAEGCEALVEKDAPQTREELCQRIVDSNPANYKPRNLWEGLTRLNIKPTFEPHKATGEELAEMAEEDGNA